MSIEDVQYLLENSVQDSALYFIDSSKRDRSIYPSPSQYSITLTDSVRMVYGFDILDAAIPSTMYNIDSHNNRLCFMLFNILVSEHSLENMRDMFRELGSFPRIFDYINNSYGYERRLLIMDPGQFASAVEDRGRVPVPFLSPQYRSLTSPAVICIRHDVVANIMSDDTGSVYRNDPDKYYSFKYHGKRMVIERSDPSSSIILGLDGEDAGVTVLLMPVPINPSAYASPSTYLSSLSSFFIPTSMRMIRYEVVETVMASVESYSLYPNLMDVAMHEVSISPGTYVLDKLQTQMQNQFGGAFGLEIEAGNALGSDIEFKFVYSHKSPLAFNMQSSTLRTTLGFDDYRSPNDVGGGYTVLEFGSNPSMFMSLVDPISGRYRMTSPGIINLLGERYVKLRCPEIEDHINGSAGNASDQFGVGLGVFKLASGNEITHIRFDFVNLIRKPFHPIGRLTRMTFRFELTNGSLYDFKGVNHQMLVSLKYLVPTPKMKFEGSKLNPEYRPDYMSYLMNLGRYVDMDPSRETEGDESGENEEGDSEEEREQDEDEEQYGLLQEYASGKLVNREGLDEDTGGRYANNDNDDDDGNYDYDDSDEYEEE